MPSVPCLLASYSSSPRRRTSGWPLGSAPWQFYSPRSRKFGPFNKSLAPPLFLSCL